MICDYKKAAAFFTVNNINVTAINTTIASMAQTISWNSGDGEALSSLRTILCSTGRSISMVVGCAMPAVERVKIGNVMIL